MPSLDQSADPAPHATTATTNNARLKLMYFMTISFFEQL
jgi:hypothetical protein